MPTDLEAQPTQLPPSPVPSLVDATAGRVAAAALGLGSFLRRRRVFHPDGIALAGTLRVDSAGDHGARLLDEAADHPCTVRLSRGIGLPDGTPDILGVAVRVPHGGDLQDLLFATTIGDGAITQHVLAPAQSFADRPLSTILPHRTERGLVTLTLTVHETDAKGLVTLDAAARAFEAGRLTFDVRATAPRGASTLVGRLLGGPRLSPEATEGLRFNPFNAAADLQPAGALNALRRRSYRASQAARP